MLAQSHYRTKAETWEGADNVENSQSDASAAGVEENGRAGQFA